MVRPIVPIVPKKDISPSLSASDPSTDSKSSKRWCVPSACVPCRKRKSKCDGGTPVCATCTAVYKTECYYDAESEGRRKAAVKRDSTAFKGSDKASTAETLLASIKTLPEADLQELIQQIRADEDLDALAESIRKANAATPASRASGVSSLPLDLSAIMGKSMVLNSGGTRVWGHSSGLGLVLEDEKDTGHRAPSTHPQYSTWTSVTEDMDFVLELIELYFTWSNPFYQVCSKKYFMESFRSGHGSYCSPLLVNAICAYGCHFSDRPEARVNPRDSRTAGDRFFAEAKRLLYENEDALPTTVQALAVMSVREPSSGRDSSGFMYSGRALRMAIELGLHLTLPEHLDPIDEEVRCMTFWGCFTMDSAWSLCIGRISQLPRAAITLKKPLPDSTSGNDEYWRPFPDNPNLNLDRSNAPHLSQNHLYHLSLLSELVNDTVFMFYAPKDRFTSRKLLDQYSKYRSWYQNLPDCLRLNGAVPVAHVFDLHMYYHTCVLHLFRPIMRMMLTNSDIVPRQVCVSSANEVSNLMNMYRQHYSLRRANLILTHICLAAGLVHLMNAGERFSAVNLSQTLHDLRALSQCHHFAARGFKIICLLAAQYGIPLPGDVSQDVESGEQESVPPSSGSFYPPGSTAGYNGNPVSSSESRPNIPGITQPHQFQPGSLTQDQNYHAPIGRNSYQPAHIVSQGGSSGAIPTQFAMHHPNAPHHLPSESLHAQQQQPPNPPPGSVPPSFNMMQSEPGDLFWSPIGFAGQGVPIANTEKPGPMDLPKILENVDNIEQLKNDGFKPSNEYFYHDPMVFTNQGHHQPHHLDGDMHRPPGTAQEHQYYGNKSASSSASGVPHFQGGQWYS